MNAYYRNYQKYLNLSMRDYEEFSDLISAIDEERIPAFEGKPISNAIIIMGFSGNGKTTIISEFLQKHPDYTVVSVDKISESVKGKGNRREYVKGETNEFGDNLTLAIGEKLESLLSQGKKVIIDGNYLNLFTRMTLIDTLREAGYNINLLDITGQVEETLPFRIERETERVLGKESEVSIKKREIYYRYFAEYIYEYYQHERHSAFFDLQKQNGVLDYGVDKYIQKQSLDTPVDEDALDSIKPQMR